MLNQTISNIDIIGILAITVGIPTITLHILTIIAGVLPSRILYIIQKIIYYKINGII